MYNYSPSDFDYHISIPKYFNKPLCESKGIRNTKVLNDDNHKGNG